MTLREMKNAFCHRYILTESIRSTDLTTTQLNITTSEGALLVPAQGVITLNGRDSKILVTDYVFGQSATTILYSTAE